MEWTLDEREYVLAFWHRYPNAPEQVARMAFAESIRLQQVVEGVERARRNGIQDAWSPTVGGFPQPPGVNPAP